MSTMFLCRILSEQRADVPQSTPHVTLRVLQSAANLSIIMLAGGKHTCSKRSESKDPHRRSARSFILRSLRGPQVRGNPLPVVIARSSAHWCGNPHRRTPRSPTLVCHFDQAQRAEKSAFPIIEGDSSSKDGFSVPAGRCGHRPLQLKGEKRIPTGINALGMTRGEGMPLDP